VTNHARNKKNASVTGNLREKFGKNSATQKKNREDHGRCKQRVKYRSRVKAGMIEANREGE
jgi:hypothetical protein